MALSCSSLIEACLLLDVVRGHDREARDPPTRCWAFRGGEWVRVASNVPLAVEREGRWVPNPAVFRVAPAVERPAAQKLF